MSATYTITPSATSVNEGSSVTFTVDTKNVEWGSALSYTLTGISQADLASGSLTGTTIIDQQGVDGRAVVTVNLANDQLAENESVTLIVDTTPALPIIQFASMTSSANEGNTSNTTITVQATLSAASTQTVTVPITYSGTATSGSDYLRLWYNNASSSITIAAGQTTGSASFSVLGDTTSESNETVVLTMGAPTNAALGANTTFTHTIVNDDVTSTPSQPTGAFLSEGNYIALGSALVNVFGAAGMETVMLGAGSSQVVLDQNVDRVYLSAAP
ncbi:MAG: hypothetical protein EB072_14790, partial [Betaproteobacteria bacterium]|nr:hypothetical protein [Betaproteobacteria bacterium]